MRSDRMERKPPAPRLDVQECRERIRRNPEDLEARVLLGMTYRLEGDFAAALETWKGVLEIDPGYAPAMRLIRSLQAELTRIGCPIP